MDKKLMLSVILILFINVFNGYGQELTLSGFIRDAESGEVLIGSTIFNAELGVGTATNNYGFYSLTLPAKDTVLIVYSYVGYEMQLKKIVGDNDLIIDISLIKKARELTEVTVKSSRNTDNVERARVGVIDVPIMLIKGLPAIGGEIDVLKTIQLLPGVNSGKEGTTGFHVRGGRIDQNLILLDEATIYNPSHLFGIFSTFNSNALNNVTLIKGGFPAQYGGRLSSVLEVTLKEGNKNKHAVSGGIGMYTSNLTFEGPINKGVGSFMVSGRRTYFDVFTKPIIPSNKRGSNYYFYDVNAKINYSLTSKDRIFFSLFSGLDDANYTSANSLNYGINFGNKTATFRWNHIYSNKVFSNTSVIYNDFHNSLLTSQGNYVSQIYSGIRDFSIKSDWQILFKPTHIMKVGAIYSSNTYFPASTSSQISESDILSNLKPGDIPQKQSDQFAFYISDELKVNAKLSLNLGVRIPWYKSEGKSYQSIEPRATIKYSTGRSSSLKASFTMMNQFLHLVPSSTASLPTDVWISSSDIVKPGISRQYSLGWFRNFKNNTIETSVEAYYKTMDNQVLFKEGALPEITKDIDQQLTFGDGESYGIEFFAQKKAGRLTGWASYTLSWSDQQFDELNYGRPFPSTYDKRHSISIVGTYKINKKWTFASDWVYTSGSAYTLPLGKIPVFESGSLYDGFYYDYTERNNYRFRPYHRLDVSFTRQSRPHKLFGFDYQAEWVFSVYNLYARQNTYYTYLSVDYHTKEPVAKEVSLLPMVPGVSWNFKF